MKISPGALPLIGCFFVFNAAELLANGGAWPTGVPSTGNAAPSDKARATEVTIEDENLTLNLHQEFADVEVRYRMRNTGPKVVQDFFFPIERWQAGEDTDMPEGKAPNLEGYSIKVDNGELKAKTINVAAPKEAEATPTPDESSAATTPEPQGEAASADESGTEDAAEPWGEVKPLEVPSDLPPPTRHWKKSEIPFASRFPRTRTIPVQLDERGYPQLMPQRASVAGSP